MCDLTTRPTNPAHDLHARYERLMQLTDPDELRSEAVSVVRSWEGRGISRSHVVKFVRTVSGLCGLEALQRYVTNFVLAASNLRVI